MVSARALSCADFLQYSKWSGIALAEYSSYLEILAINNASSGLCVASAGACGQLVVQSGQKGKGEQRSRAGCSKDSKDIEEIGKDAVANPGKAPRSIWNLFGTVA